MKVVILAGGLGTRLSEETHTIPKPMVSIQGKPLLWHIMKWYSQFGFNDFIICLGYKGYVIKEYFFHYFLHNSDLSIDLKHNQITYHAQYAEPWTITMIDTGLHTQTGGRLKRIQPYVGNESFFMTYGDGVGNVDLSALIHCHKKNKKLATVTAVQPAGRWGVLQVQKNDVVGFSEKTDNKNSLINGGFFVLEPGIFSYIKEDSTVWEKEPLETLSANNQLNAYVHQEFWKAMDTMRDKIDLETALKENPNLLLRKHTND